MRVNSKRLMKFERFRQSLFQKTQYKTFGGELFLIQETIKVEISCNIANYIQQPTHFQNFSQKHSSPILKFI